MAVSAVSSYRLSYAALRRPSPTPTEEVMAASAATSVDDSLRRPRSAAPEPTPVFTPYVNAQGEITGMAIDTTA